MLRPEAHNGHYIKFSFSSFHLREVRQEFLYHFIIDKVMIAGKSTLPVSNRLGIGVRRHPSCRRVDYFRMIQVNEPSHCLIVSRRDYDILNADIAMEYETFVVQMLMFLQIQLVKKFKRIAIEWLTADNVTDNSEQFI